MTYRRPFPPPGDPYDDVEEDDWATRNVASDPWGLTAAVGDHVGTSPAFPAAFPGAFPGVDSSSKGKQKAKAGGSGGGHNVSWGGAVADHKHTNNGWSQEGGTWGAANGGDWVTEGWDQNDEGEWGQQPGNWAGGSTSGWGVADSWSPPAAPARQEGWKGWAQEAKHKGVSSWGVPAAAAAPRQEGWKGWADEAKHNSFAGSGNKSNITAQQQHEILKQFLSGAGTNPYLVESSFLDQNGYPHDFQYPDLHMARNQQNQQKQQKGNGQNNQQGLSKKERKRLREEQAALEAKRWQGKQNFADTWGVSDYGWGPIPEEDEEDYGDSRHVRFSPKGAANLWALDTERNTTYSMPSKTMAHAAQGTTKPVSLGVPYNKINDYTDVNFIESKGEALRPVQNALFGKTRLAKDRIHWMFSPEKDDRVSTLLMWIQAMSYNLGAFGVKISLKLCVRPY
jgi:hypothetical protein